MFRLVARPFLVKTGSFFIRLAVFMRIPFSWAIGPVFKHFCGGESIEDATASIKKLGKSGLFTILDYAAEGKQQESDFQKAFDQILLTIDKAHSDPLVPFAVFKPSGLVRAELLEKWQNGNALSASEQSEAALFKNRLLSLFGRAASYRVPVMVDAEESWIQQVVDQLTEEMMVRFNTNAPLVYTTLQMYRTDRMDYLRELHRRAREKGIFIGVKLVRGAYMEKERERAFKLGQPSPIHPDKAATDAAFDDAVAYCISHIDEIAVCIGTHNEQSCLLAIGQMHKRGIQPSHPHISFSQLLGMSDHISYAMAAAQYRVCKYVPYGPVNTVLPYLIRRAEENTSVAGQTSRELFLIKQELRRRKNQGL